MFPRSEPEAADALEMQRRMLGDEAPAGFMELFTGVQAEQIKETALP